MSFRSRRSKNRSGARASIVLASLALVAVFAVPGSATLAPSTFDASDGNFLLNDAADVDPVPNANVDLKDWENAPALVAKTDMATGQSDDSFGNGTKEDTACTRITTDGMQGCPAVVDGGIPNNKSDLRRFYVANERASGHEFLYLGWTRANTLGTANMDFEFNQSDLVLNSGSPQEIPLRTAGDMLITFDFSSGCSHVDLGMLRWVTSGANTQCRANGATTTPTGCWGNFLDLDASGFAEGSVNDGYRVRNTIDSVTQPIRTFGEASIDLTASGIFPPGACTSFGSAYLKSRSSDAFTAAMKDFIAPASVNITNCGSVKIIKTDDAGTALAGATFVLYNDLAPLGGTRGAEDTITTLTCTTLADGICRIGDVLAGRYWVHESVIPEGHIGAADVAITVTADNEVSVGPLVNPRPRGAILVTKTRKHAASGPGDHPHEGVTMTVKQGTTTVATGVTDANGQVCFDNLLPGSYTVSETVPAGYRGEADKTVVVDNPARCADTPFVGERVEFSNMPLSNITVSFESQVPGGTAATISCTGLEADPADTTPTAFDDLSETFKDLEPGTYNCTVVVDP